MWEENYDSGISLGLLILSRDAGSAGQSTWGRAWGQGCAGHLAFHPAPAESTPPPASFHTATPGPPMLKTLQGAAALSKDMCLSGFYKTLWCGLHLSIPPPAHFSSHTVHLRVSQLSAQGLVLPLPSPIPVQLRVLPSTPAPAPLGARNTALCLGVDVCPGLLSVGQLQWHSTHLRGLGECHFSGSSWVICRNCQWKVLFREQWWHFLCGPSAGETPGAPWMMVYERCLGFHTASWCWREVCSYLLLPSLFPLPGTHQFSSWRIILHPASPFSAQGRVRLISSILCPFGR